MGQRRRATLAAALEDAAGPAAATITTGVAPAPPLAASGGREALGPSSRRTGLVISEIQYHPREIGGDTNDLFEFIEFYNTQPFEEEIGGYRVSGDVSYVFPSNTVLRAKSYLVLARAPVLVENYYGIRNVHGPWNGVSTNDPLVSVIRLSNGKGTVRLQDRLGGVLLEVTYQDEAPWPVLADGKGYSLVLSRPSYGEASPAAWSASAHLDGSPGQDEPVASDPLRQVVINELLANSSLPQLDFIELHNTGPQDLDISGCGLSDSPSSVKFVFRGALIPAGGYLALDEYVMGFALPAEGDTVYFTGPTGTRLDAVRYGPQAAGTSWGRVPDGGPAFHPLAPPTPFAANRFVAGGPVVIDEIMYAPLSGDSDDEYVELHNLGTNAVDLGGWMLSDAVFYSFVPGTVIPGGGYLVVARRQARLLARYPGRLTPANTVGDFGGNLSNEGERLALLRPEPLGVDGVTNFYMVLADEVEYRAGGRWGGWAYGGGSSLELVDPRSDNRLAANWADSDETAKGVWIQFEATGTIDHVDAALGANDRLQVMLLGAGEALLDDVEVLTTNGVNLLGAEGTFEAGLSGWMPQGSHDLSSLEDTGFESGRSLHLRAGSAGDPEANRVLSPPLVPPAASNTVVTLRARARWVRGVPEILLRLRGGGLEAVGRLPIPTPLGTPGAPNSRAVANAGPAIREVAHDPPLPGAAEAVLVTARVSDPDGVASVALVYRVDLPGGATNVVPMLDDGTGGDLCAGDGLFSAFIPGQASGMGVAFHVQAADAASPAAGSLFPPDVFPPAGLPRVFPTDAPTRECVVRFGEPTATGAFGAYHLWLTAGNSNRWHTRAPLSRALVDATLVCASGRVIYNVGARFAGDAGQVEQMRAGPAGPLRCDYHVVCPEDDRCLGATELDWLNPGQALGGVCSDLSGQVERLCHELLRDMDLHHHPRRFVHVWVNGIPRSLSANLPGPFVMEDVWQPDLKTLREHYPDDRPAELYEVRHAFESDDSGTVFHGTEARLTRRTTEGAGVPTLKLAPYRFTWRKTGALPWQSASDYLSLLRVVEAVSPPESTADDTNALFNVADVESLVDLEEWMRVVAVQHAVGNREAYGYDRGQNAYVCRGERVDSRMTLLARDFDLALGLGGDGPSASLFVAEDPRVVGMFRTPVIRRMYLRALLELVNGPFRSDRLNPRLDAAAAAFAVEGVSYSPEAHATIKNYLAARRSYLLSQFAGLTNGFTATVQSNVNLALVTGSASVAIKDILVNGVLYPITWAPDSLHFSLAVPLVPGTNELVIWGVDRLGQPVPGASLTRTLTYNGPGYAPEGRVVLSEIMYHPPVAGASYLEIQNLATDFHFDLSGWRLDALGYTFRLGTTLAPRSFLVLAKNRAVFAAAYGDVSRVFDEFNGDFDPQGETLSLVMPGLAPGSEVVVDRVRYEPTLPWPSEADGSGAALQLIDVTADNARVSNWSTGAGEWGWRHVSLTGTLQFNATNLFIWMTGPGEVYLDDVRLMHGSTAGLQTNLLQNGGFEEPFERGWSFLGTNLTRSMITTDLAHSGSASLRVVSTGFGGTARAIVQRLPLPPTNLTCTLSFWYSTDTVSTNLIVRTYPGSQLIATAPVKPLELYTPGASNAVSAPLPPYSALWLNEVQPENRTGPADRFGDLDPWIELFNAGPELVELGACYLATHYTNLTAWRFPDDAFILPGQTVLIWADGEPEESSAGEWHTSLALEQTNGAVALVRLVDGRPQVMDYLNYTNLGPDQSYGDFPDGQPFERRVFHFPTPGLENILPPVQVVINEWVASNLGPHGYPDPADGDYEDWIELHNRGPEEANLSGLYLTDNLANKALWRIPDGTVIPAGGFLLVWADSETSQTGPGGSGDLHAGFKLNNGGEAIGLFRAVGTNSYLIDSVTFGRQYDNVSQGRFPDGASELHLMSQPTPRAPNVPGNSFPVIASAYYGGLVSLGQTFKLFLTATDPDAPPQTLTFGLVAAPGGATIDPRNGLFTFTPTEAPALVYVTVYVSDDGLPPARAMRSFHLHVGMPCPASIQGPSADGQVRLSFDTLQDSHYRVEYKTDLNESVWTTWGDNLLADGPSLFIQENILQSPQRFYRVIRLD